MADYGVLPGPIGYETFFGLVMNGPRAANRRVYYAGLAYTLATGREDIPQAVVGAACESDEQAGDLTWRMNADRAQRAMGM